MPVAAAAVVVLVHSIVAAAIVAVERAHSIVVAAVADAPVEPEH